MVLTLTETNVLINVTYKKKTISASEVIDNVNEILICIDNEPHIDIILQNKNTKVYKPYQDPRTSFQKELVQLEKEMDEKKSLIKTYREPEIRYGIKENKEGLYFNSSNEILKHLFE